MFSVDSDRGFCLNAAAGKKMRSLAETETRASQAHIKKLQEIANLVNSDNSLVLAVLSSVFIYIELWVGRDWAAVIHIIEVTA